MKKFIAAVVLALASLTSISTASADSSDGPWSGPKDDRSAAAIWVDTQGFLPPDWTAEKTGQLAQMMCRKLVVQNYSEGELVVAGHDVVDADTG